ncbi:hypothetical protein [Columbid circovirus]|uniref:Uncharacterized protein n=1 Tax=Pigeon circovirus TaxID=126070 RepID=Q91GA0_PICV|nr:hypothetical protein [Columbid circovirus]
MHQFHALNVGGRGDIEGRPSKLPELDIEGHFTFIIHGVWLGLQVTECKPIVINFLGKQAVA